MIPTLFGKPLNDGKFFICDEYSNRIPINILSARMDCSIAGLSSLNIEVGVNTIPLRLLNENHKIKKVIFNDPATIVIWGDKTKTIVKCQKGDSYSKELGLAMCFAKKFFGNKGNFNEIFKKYLKEDY